MCEQSQTVPAERIVTVRADRLDEARKEMNKLIKKARRYGASEIAVTYDAPRVETRETTDWDGVARKVSVRVVDLHITGEALRVGNHEFLARIELGDGGNLVDTRPGVTDLDERFRHTDGACQHCQKVRGRKDVFVVRDIATGEQLQIGRNCLRDYLGIDPAVAAARFRFVRDADGFDRSYGGGGGDFCQSIEGLLTLAAVSIRLFGWCSKGQAAADARLTPTVHYVYLGLNQARLDHEDSELRSKILAALSDADRDVARETLAWVRNDLKAGSDYAHNLKVLCAHDCITDVSRIGLIVSAVAGYFRDKEMVLRHTAQRANDVVSGHIGEVGKRLRGLKVVQEMARVVDGSFGECVLVKFRTEDGNLLSWFTGRGTGAQMGEKLVIDGTVKRHSEYKGIKETQLTRVAVKGAA